MNHDNVMEKLKLVLSLSLSKKIVSNIELADALGITRQHLCVVKNRNKVPVRDISYFCALHNVCINWVLFDQSVEMIEQNMKIINPLADRR